MKVLRTSIPISGAERLSVYLGAFNKEEETSPNIVYIEVTIGDWRVLVIPGTAVTAVRARSQIISVSAPDWQQHTSSHYTYRDTASIPTQSMCHHSQAECRGYQHCNNTYRIFGNEDKILHKKQDYQQTIEYLLHNAWKK